MAAHRHDHLMLQAMDEAAWAALQDDFLPRIHQFLLRQVRDHQVAEDLAQETFLGAVRGIGSYDPAYTLEQFLFGIARNRLVDHFRKHRIALLPAKGDGEAPGEAAWIENLPDGTARPPSQLTQQGEELARQRRVLADILRELVAGLWQAGEFRKLQVLEYLFVLGGRNRDAAQRFGYADESAVAGVKFRALEQLRGLARQRDPNHSLFLGLWKPGAR